MKKLLSVLFFAFMGLGIAGCGAREEQTERKPFDWEKKVGARTAPDGGLIYYAGDYGAVGDGIRLNTEAIQEAIDQCAKTGGGTVKFTPGIYLTGAIYLKSGVDLHLDKGVVLKASENLSDFPEIETRVAGIEMAWPSAVVNAIDQEKISVTGTGTIDGSGKVWWDKYHRTRRQYERQGLRWIVDYDVQRVRGILIQNCRNAILSDFVLYQTGFWGIHILYSQYVTVDGVVINNNIGGHGPSTDGIDIDSSSDILVQNCDINCNDDNFCLKAGRDADGLRVNRPTERVVIRNCIARQGGGLLTFGSETSGGIRDVVAYGLKGLGTRNGLRFKSAYTRGGTVENIYLYDIQMVNMHVPIQVDLNWNPSYSYSRLPEGYDPERIPEHWRTMLEEVPEEQGMPTFRNVFFEEITATDCHTAISVNGTEKSPVEGFHLKNVKIEADEPGHIRWAKNWTLDQVSIRARSSGEPIEIENSNGLETLNQQ